MRKLLTFLFLMMMLVSMFAQNLVQAAEPASNAQQLPYKALQVQIMPEFDYPDDWPKDKPSLLIGNYGTLVNKGDKDYSGDIELTVPAKEANFELYMVAEFPKTDQPEVQRPYKLDKEKGIVTWKPANPIKAGQEYRFVVEYYYNPIKVSDKKSFSYQFSAPGNADLTDLIVYAPIGAKDFTISPKAMNQSKSDFGEDLYHYQYKQLKAGEQKTFQVAYTKPDNKSSLSVIQSNMPKDSNHAGVSGNAASNAQAAASAAVSKPIIDATAASIIGISLIIMGALIYFGLRGRPVTAEVSVNGAANTVTGARTKKGHKKDSVEERKKNLRKMLINGEIDEKTYNARIANLREGGDDM
jgi:hypothetical protein